MLQHLKLLAKIEALQKKVTDDFDFLSDIDILKSFNLPISTGVEDIHEGTLVYKLLSGRSKRPSSNLWTSLLGFTKSVNAEDPAHMAAEIYFEVLFDMPDLIYTPASNEELAKEEQMSSIDKAIVEPGKYPPRDDTHPDDAMPNITGGQADVQGGTFLSDDGEGKDCKT